MSMTLAYARNVLETEAKAIIGLIPLLDENFEKATDWVASCSGRVVVTGMGKSGLIAQKISATFASTGTPSLYLHPAEAIHGDLGRVLKEDILLSLSNGGETEELVRLIPCIRRIGSKIISITGNPESTLGKHSDLVLWIGKIEEACPLGLAPTTSTTVMLALGDALAMCVSQKRHFTREEYALYHPGGSLGRKLMKVSEIMRTGDANPCVPTTTTVVEVLFAITKARAGAAIMVDSQGKLCGIFTDGDLRRRLKNQPNLLQLPISEAMTKNPITVHQDTLVVDALRILKEKKIDEVPVIDSNGYPAGMLDVQDVLDVGML
jgi:arabinose-5-phosphate isomerase